MKFFLAFINKVIHLKMRNEKDAPVLQPMRQEHRHTSRSDAGLFPFREEGIAQTVLNPVVAVFLDMHAQRRTNRLDALLFE
ncbi:hypothetical protein F6Q07_03105 [Pectobacterium parmentieri]|uniref:Uncharacterized protein n=2 Tax=Pectobacterium parmentieri TaxID=1905730 RepID=A0A8B3FFD5_PECPM|nr:hypothetical protein [Pectobacterium parmentieri]AYH03190.1 hypothetical protein C5E26_20795 [Pectobacterium parmentieri]AYH07519.1 hypothetical protein C5E25_20235 [Pectobacterium parmentieri]AYH11986.1 hypothetical protein C5E24_20955 [Pectobacterium parmentieri]AYH16271.1 hypothetical protein C5E23_19830 [Pectobacterium parmentieri]AYH24972.1 hypothetical protein C5E21_19865 [Pectobacterium parmentieri]